MYIKPVMLVVPAPVVTVMLPLVPFPTTAVMLVALTTV